MAAAAAVACAGCAVGGEHRGADRRACPPGYPGPTQLHAISTTHPARIQRFPLFNGFAAFEHDGRGGWLVGGTFTCVNGVAAARLVRLTAAGALDESWTPKLPGCLTGGGIFERFRDTLYLGGHRCLVAIDVDSAAMRWMLRANGMWGVSALVADGHRVYVAGDFTRLGGTSIRGLAALDPASGEVLTWPAPKVVGDVLALGLSGRHLFIGGSFVVGGRRNLVRIDTHSGRVAAWTPDTQRGLVPGTVPAVERMLVTHGLVITTGHEGWHVTDARTGRTRAWMHSVGASASAFAIADDTLYLAEGCRIGLFEFDGERRYNLAAVQLPSGRATPWAPRIGTRWDIDTLPGYCFSAIAATRRQVLVEGSTLD